MPERLSPPECVASDAVEHYRAHNIPASVAAIESDREAIRKDERERIARWLETLANYPCQREAPAAVKLLRDCAAQVRKGIK